jgi:hypothetical protein
MFILGALTILFGILPFIFFDMMSDWSTKLLEDILVAALENQGVNP